MSSGAAAGVRIALGLCLAFPAAAVPPPEPHVKMATELYQRLRSEAIRGSKKCLSSKLPPQITFDRQDYVNAAAMRDAQSLPQLVVYKGLLDFDGLVSYFAIDDTPSGRFRVFEVVLAKAKSSDANLRAEKTWPDWTNPRARKWGWSAAYRSRLAFDIAHEMGHLCLGHLQGHLDGFEIAAQDGTTLQGWSPAVLLNLSENAGKSAKGTAAAAQDLEATADKWAIELLDSAHEVLDLSNIQGTIGAVAELGVLDAAGGRSSLQSGGFTYAHPVGHDRFRLVWKLLSTRGESVEYVDLVEKVIMCLEQAPIHRPPQDPLALLEALVASGRSICDVEIAALERAIPAQLVMSPKGKTDIKVVVDGNEAVPMIARADNRNGALWLSAISRREGKGSWSTSVDRSSKYALQFAEAASGGTFSVYVGGARVAAGTFGAYGEISQLREGKRAEWSGKLMRELSFSVGPSSSEFVRPDWLLLSNKPKASADP